MNYANELAEELTLEYNYRVIGLALSFEKVLAHGGAASVSMIAAAYSKFSNKGESTPNMLIYAKGHAEEFVEFAGYSNIDALNATNYVVNKVWGRKAETTRILNPELNRLYLSIQAKKSELASVIIGVNRAKKGRDDDTWEGGYLEGVKTLATLWEAEHLLAMTRMDLLK